jgi:hypothetical protein
MAEYSEGRDSLSSTIRIPANGGGQGGSNLSFDISKQEYSQVLHLHAYIYVLVPTDNHTFLLYNTFINAEDRASER